MEKAVERLRQFISSLPHPYHEYGWEIVEEFEKWQNAMFSKEDLDEMGIQLDDRIMELKKIIKSDLALKDVIEYASSKMEVDLPFSFNEEALETVREAIVHLGKKLEKVNQIRTLIEIEGIAG